MSSKNIIYIFIKTLKIFNDSIYLLTFWFVFLRIDDWDTHSLGRLEKSTDKKRVYLSSNYLLLRIVIKKKTKNFNWLRNYDLIIFNKTSDNCNSWNDLICPLKIRYWDVSLGKLEKIIVKIMLFFFKKKR